MTKKLPPDALGYYLSLGPKRSYQDVAERFGVSKRSVTSAAVREDWQARVAEADSRVRERASEDYVESVQAMNERHLKVLRFIQGRSIETLKSMPIDSAMDAVRAYTASIAQERQIRGDPAQRTLTIAAIIKRETESLLRPVGEDDWSALEASAAGVSVLASSQLAVAESKASAEPPGCSPQGNASPGSGLAGAPSDRGS